jgi:hypothetical protein
MQTKAIAVIRHSLAAANAALDLLISEEPTVGVQSTVVEAAPAPTVVEAAPAPKPQFNLTEALYNELSDSEFDLRTEAELKSKYGVSSSELYSALADMDESYVTRTRRTDSAPLVGLSSRN